MRGLDYQAYVVAFIAIVALLIVAGEPRLAFGEEERIANTLVVPSWEFDNGLALVIDEEVNKVRLEEISQMEYDELKARLGVSKDFAVYFTDENGSLIEIGGRACIGSPKAVVAGSRCG